MKKILLILGLSICLMGCGQYSRLSETQCPKGNWVEISGFKPFVNFTSSSFNEKFCVVSQKKLDPNSDDVKPYYY